MTPKYRAWKKAGKELGRVGQITFELDGSVSHVLFKGKFLDFNVPINEIILMQSTGLVDRDGKEIFEGDILCDEGIEQESEFVYVTVSYREGMWVCDQITDELCGYGGALNEFNNDYSIIGNIYENPELLEDKE
ncbi:TPA: YopX family protein [Streptococcus pneumoniae]